MVSKLKSNPKKFKNMTNWAPYIYGVLGGLAYFVSCDILSDWNRWYVLLFATLILAVAYWLIPKKVKPIIRILVSVAVTIGAAAIVALIRN